MASSMSLTGSAPVLRCLVLLALILLSQAGAAEVKVLASIKPLALIANEVAGGKATVETLLPIKASPHDYPLRVSDVRRLQQADVVLWVGPELEVFLQRPLNNIAASKRLTVYELPGMNWPEEEPHAHADGAGHHHGHDPHVWLDPRNAIVIARALAEKFGEIDPDSAAFYAENADHFSQAVTGLDQRLATTLAPVRHKGFAVYHEGYLHFVERYDLEQLAYVTFTPERRPGAKHLYDLRKKLKNQALCLFTEPYYDMRIAKDLAAELELNVAVLDPIGEEDVASYQQLLEKMAQAFSACLANGSVAGEMQR